MTNGLAPDAGAPPHDEEAEASVLGAILLADRWMDPLVSEVGLTRTDFYRPRHRVIFEVMLGMHACGEVIDTLTLSDELGAQIESAGGKDYIETLVTRVVAIGNTKQYGQIVKEQSLLRNLIQLGHDVQARVASGEGTAEEILDAVQHMVGEIGLERDRGGLRAVEDVLIEQIDAIQAAGKRTEGLLGAPSGLTELDEILDGFQPGKLYVVAGRPSMGKSALVATIAPAAAGDGYPVAIFTMEMDDGEIVERMLAARGRFQGSELRKGKLEGPAWQKLQEVGSEISQLPIEIDDTAGQTVASIRSKVRRESARRIAKDEPPIGLVMIDYLHLLRSEDPRLQRTYQVEEQMRALKRMARELNIPVILLSQLSREVERRSPPIPQLSDLKDSGAIEQDADCVILMYREDYYRSDSERPGEADLIVAKQRGGETGTIEVAFIAHYPAFKDLLGRPEKSLGKRPLSVGWVAGRDDPGEQEEEVVF